MVNPAQQRFVDQLTHSITVGQVAVRRHSRGFELRHVDDSKAEETRLRLVAVNELRSLSQFTASGDFRPLKSAPDLKDGWTCLVRSDVELGRALDQLYPGFLADWFATLDGIPPVTHFRSFMARQTGVYGTVNSLSDVDAAMVIRACCARRFCLKRRLWSVQGLATDALEVKSAIPCLEPCALLLEFGRHAVDLLKDGPQVSGREQAAPPPSEGAAAAGMRAADFTDPRNPRRVQLECERAK